LVVDLRGGEDCWAEEPWREVKEGDWLMLRRRAKLGRRSLSVTVLLLLLPVDCDQRLRLPMPSRMLPMLSWATWATLARRADCAGGGVGREEGLEVCSSGPSRTDAARVTVTTDDDSELLLEAGRGGS
jgi:hypothetical protein